MEREYKKKEFLDELDKFEKAKYSSVDFECSAELKKMSYANEDADFCKKSCSEDRDCKFYQIKDNQCMIFSSCY